MTYNARRLALRTLRLLRTQCALLANQFECELITYELPPMNVEAWCMEDIGYLRAVLPLGRPQVYADNVETEGFDDLATMPGSYQGWKVLLRYGDMDQAKASLEALCGTLVRAAVAIPSLEHLVQSGVDDPELDAVLEPVETWMETLDDLARGRRIPGVWHEDAGLAVATDGVRPNLYSDRLPPVPLDQTPHDFVDRLRRSLADRGARVYRIPGVLLATVNAIDWMLAR